jgi:hypothetical protein
MEPGMELGMEPARFASLYFVWIEHAIEIAARIPPIEAKHFQASGMSGWTPNGIVTMQQAEGSLAPYRLPRIRPIEAALAALNMLRRSCDRLLARNVDLDKVHIAESGPIEFSDGLPAAVPAVRCIQRSRGLNRAREMVWIDEPMGYGAGLGACGSSFGRIDKQ